MPISFNSQARRFPSPNGSGAISPPRALSFPSQRQACSSIAVSPGKTHSLYGLIEWANNSRLPTDWSPDGRYIVYQDFSEKDFDLWVLPLFEERKPELFLQTDYADLYGRFSPDGRWITYVSNESGKREVYVRGFPAAGGKWQISNGGGGQPHWRRDGKELFYVTADKKLMAVEVNGSSGTFEAGIPKSLFDLRINTTNGFSDYDV